MKAALVERELALQEPHGRRGIGDQPAAPDDRHERFELEPRDLLEPQPNLAKGGAAGCARQFRARHFLEVGDVVQRLVDLRTQDLYPGDVVAGAERGLIENLGREHRDAVVEPMLLFDGIVRPFDEHVAQHLVDQLFGQGRALPGLQITDRVFILVQALAPERELPLDAVAIDRGQLRVGQTGLIIGRQLLVIRVRFEDEHGAAERAEFEEALEVVGVVDAQQDRRADDLHGRETKAVRVLRPRRAFEIEPEWDAGRSLRRADQKEHEGHDRIDDGQSEHRQQDQPAVGAKGLHETAQRNGHLGVGLSASLHLCSLV